MNGLRPPARHAAAVALLALLALLAGCGPGVGGTGTGDGIAAPPQHTATAAPVCAADFAAALACPSRSTGSAAPEGTAPVWFADSEPAARVSALFEANGVSLRAPCARVQFTGRWGDSPTLGSRFFGTLTVDGVDRIGTLEVTLADDRLTLLPRDEAGQPVAVLPALQRAAGEPAAAACP